MKKSMVNGRKRRTIFTSILTVCLVAIPWIGCGGGGSDSSGPPIAPINYSIEKTHLMYRNSENAANNRYQGVIGISENGSAIQDTDVIDVVIRDSGSNTMIPDSEAFYHYTFLFLDCMTGTCTQSGPNEETGIKNTWTTVLQDVYGLEIEMENSQILTASVDYPGQLILPFVASSSMQASWVSDDLELSWTNPTGSLNWSDVDQLRIILFDNNDNNVLLIRMSPTSTTVTIPAALITQSVALLGGSSLTRWRIQTRAYDAAGMNIGRGYSNKMNLP